MYKSAFYFFETSPYTDNCKTLSTMQICNLQQLGEDIVPIKHTNRKGVIYTAQRLMLALGKHAFFTFTEL